METASRIHPPVVAPPMRAPIPLTKPKTSAVPDEERVRDHATQPEEHAAEYFCAQCRHARFDRMRSSCICASVSSEFAHQQVFSVQVACGWFVKRGLVLSWPLFSARKL